MIDSYSRGSVMLRVHRPTGSTEVKFTISRAEPLTADEVRRVNDELADYPSARGAHLARAAHEGRWEVRDASGVVLDHDGGDDTATLRWTGQV
ncbi:hypothetical protein H7J07_05150 [Mycobacterium koreense]|uniref:Uncharacterized protein n=1 Tax=Mycolicibacillus koreensis TaxID=1069220 RepID=A0A7I7SCH2_9MYCO|nr:hypothetical protein [Mycolicibacillus koreensis]MCV7247611.1 hypothetical protein [Mycolicibacillus koreensis]OSC32813.1 hypothetical protein B8W67_13750 [Mycolicibacillus koreensis]BBY53989.1 hypothetical protein MKOR_12400 [Mycolicibacillus koreensis]